MTPGWAEVSRGQELPSIAQKNPARDRSQRPRCSQAPAASPSVAPTPWCQSRNADTPVASGRSGDTVIACRKPNTLSLEKADLPRRRGANEHADEGRAEESDGVYC